VRKSQLDTRTRLGSLGHLSFFFFLLIFILLQEQSGWSLARLPDVLPYRPGFFADKFANLGGIATLNSDITRWAIKTHPSYGIFGVPNMFRYQDSAGEGLTSGEGRILVTGLYYIHATLRFDFTPCTSLVNIRMLIDINRRLNLQSGYTVVSRDFECSFSVRCQGRGPVASAFQGLWKLGGARTTSRLMSVPKITSPFHRPCRRRHLSTWKRAASFVFAPARRRQSRSTPTAILARRSSLQTITRGTPRTSKAKAFRDRATRQGLRPNSTTPVPRDRPWAKASER
jgi:hypothetical protein